MLSFPFHFLLLSLSPPSPFLSDVRTCWMALQRYIILRCLVFCVMIPWVNGPKCDNLLQFNTSCLGSLGTWYYFRLCFSFSYSGYDLTLIKMTHKINRYSSLQKFLLTTKTQKLVVGNYGSSIYCWNNKFRKNYLLFCYFYLVQ